MNDTEEEQDAPPFALTEDKKPQHLFSEEGLRHLSSSASNKINIESPKNSDEHVLSLSSTTCMHDLVESSGTEKTANSTDSDSQDVQQTKHELSHINTSSIFLRSSLPSLSSDIGGSSRLFSTNYPILHSGGISNEYPLHQASKADSSTYSQLIREVDAHDDSMCIATEPDTCDRHVMENSLAEGTLIASPAVDLRSDTSIRQPKTRWLPNIFATSNTSARTELEEPLLDMERASDRMQVTTSPSESELMDSLSKVQCHIEDDHSFEISMEIPISLAAGELIDIIARPEFLHVWCEPVESLVVTSTSNNVDESDEQGREYEGEWIEATTSALTSPPSSVAFLYSASQSFSDALGLASYGNVKIFVERPRGQIGITIGPFSGGINVNHDIRILEENERLRLVDQVRLSRESTGSSWSSMIFCGVLDTCLLSPCLTPSIRSYMKQASTSMARLRLLVGRIHMAVGEDALDIGNAEIA